MAFEKKRVPRQTRVAPAAAGRQRGGSVDARLAATRRLQDANVALRELHAALERSTDELRQLRQVGAEFFSTVGHELRTPLHAILGYADLLLEELYGELGPRQQRCVSAIRSNALHLIELVNNVLEFARANAGQVQLKPAKFLLGESVQAAVETIRPTAEARQITLQVEIANGRAPFVADPVRFRQILLNLLSNAVKYSDPGGVVSVSARTDEDGCVVSVSDNGPGIDPAYHEVIFEEFRRLPPAERDSDRPGAGLGLAITRRLVELHGGAIRLDSKLGHGSTFTVTLPACKPNPH